MKQDSHVVSHTIIHCIYLFIIVNNLVNIEFHFHVVVTFFTLQINSYMTITSPVYKFFELQMNICQI